MSSSPGTAGGTPTKQVKTDSWMDDVMRTNNGSGKSGKIFSNLLEMERFGNASLSLDASTVDYNPVDDIPMLPDADELQESLLYNESPNLPSVTTYKQLSSDLFPQGKSSLGSLDEIDISILTEGLESEKDIEEPDEPWHWDKLFAHLSVQISAEAKTTATSAGEPKN
ncbi:intraflagellar transport protein 43 homolog A [Sabethes cyaneus]|uniref:intraflagellar transport protein 43 homolog A n=1 Tax=Sabethes cyaneus TaxID=53552 RepID=UPI00237E59B8|nr:intraflagellar transport protein 43 homolog A [Sabethes cyaneus]